MRRRWAALAWAVGAAALFVLFLRISLTISMTSDVANNGLQALDMLHGHLLLHGWIIGDATYYTFDVPLIAAVELFLGLHAIAMHVSLALIYLIVAALAAVLAVADSAGASRAARAAVVVAVLAGPTLVSSDRWVPLGLPDHTGTTVFLLVACLLVNRPVAGRSTVLLLCAILAAGQIGDVTVRYVAVPAIAVMCAYRMIAARQIRTRDGASLLAAVASVPLSLVVRAVMLHAGAYVMVSPKATIAPLPTWPHNAALAGGALLNLFGAHGSPGYRPEGTAVIFGFACLLVAAIGVGWALWGWRTSASRAEQVLSAAVVANLVIYVVSTLPAIRTQHDLVTVLPGSAILAARALVPARFADRLAARAVAAFALVAALLPLSVAAAEPLAPGNLAQVSAWLSANGLRYGLGGYWDGSAVTLQSGDGVQVRTVQLVNGRKITLHPWETNSLWFNPARHRANFLIIDLTNHDLGPAAERSFGRPARTHRIGTFEILIYRKNLLTLVKPVKLPATN